MCAHCNAIHEDLLEDAGVTVDTCANCYILQKEKEKRDANHHRDLRRMLKVQSEEVNPISRQVRAQSITKRMA